MRRMAPRDVLGFAIAIGFAGLTVMSANRWSAAAEQPGFIFPLMPADEAEAAAATSPELQSLKLALAEAGGFFETHNEVYAAVGPERWEAEVKPAMVRSLLGRMVVDTGILIPTDEQVVQWARENPESVRETVRAFLPTTP